jgi:hypothetical protein
MAVAVHALIFALALYFIDYIPILNRIEGFAGSPAVFKLYFDTKAGKLSLVSSSDPNIKGSISGNYLVLTMPATKIASITIDCMTTSNKTVKPSSVKLTSAKNGAASVLAVPTISPTAGFAFTAAQQVPLTTVQIGPLDNTAGGGNLSGTSPNITVTVTPA